MKDQVFWYKATEHEDFKVGHSKIWEYHNARYNSKHKNERDHEKEEIDKLRQKYSNSRKLKVLVSREGEVVDGYLTD
jgi:hypothetical protein